MIAEGLKSGSSIRDSAGHPQVLNKSLFCLLSAYLLTQAGVGRAGVQSPSPQLPGGATAPQLSPVPTSQNSHHVHTKLC